jgi:hypothetical protein
MRPEARSLFSVFIRYLVRFLRSASARRRAAHATRMPRAAPTYPSGAARPVSLDSLTTLI